MTGVEGQLRSDTVHIDPFAPNPPGQYCDPYVGVVQDLDPGNDLADLGHSSAVQHGHSPDCPAHCAPGAATGPPRKPRSGKGSRSTQRRVRGTERSPLAGYRPVDPDYLPVVRTEHFCVRKHGRRIEVSHNLLPEDLDNDLAGMLADELFSPGWLCGAHIFERVFTGVVRSTLRDPTTAWDTFYRNTLVRIRDAWAEPEAGRDGSYRTNRSTIASFAPIYRRAMALVPAGSVLDLGSCFGFLPLLLATRPMNSVIASDISAGSMDLLDAMARRRGLPVRTLVCDAAQVPLPDRSVDSVTLIHLLEHLDPVTGNRTLAEALRLARRRVVVAVPYEDEPSPAYGHIRTFDPARLTQAGRLTGYRFAVSEFHGGWLVINTS